MDWMTEPYRRYFDFAGRSTRREYWSFALFAAAVTGLWGACLSFSAFGVFPEQGRFAAFDPPATFWALVFCTGLWLLFTVPPFCAVTVRRLHDLGQPGWWTLLPLAAGLWSPWAGGVAGFFLLGAMCLDSQRGRNRFGTDPKFRLGYRLST